VPLTATVPVVTITLLPLFYNVRTFYIARYTSSTTEFPQKLQLQTSQGNVHGHVYLRVVPKLHSGPYSWYQYTSTHQCLLLEETKRYQAQGYVTFTAISNFHALKKNLTDTCFRSEKALASTFRKWSLQRLRRRRAREDAMR